ncbi:MAG: SUMF1/EgtB/PvdO family nonheme iron enzyme [Anaerolineae bacterium]|nr:SUMF1/EgtB/PvdO family nonheme iron enzyme [Anaerolineae bacterium]
MDNQASFQQRFVDYLKQLKPSQLVGAGGLAVLCASAALAYDPSWGPLATWLGSLGLNVLAGSLQQFYQSIHAEKSDDEIDRIAALAKTLEPDIRRQAELRIEVGAFLDKTDAFAIAIAAVEGDVAVHGWLLTKIYIDVTQYRLDFDHIHVELAEIKRLLEADPTAAARQEALRNYLETIARRTSTLPLTSLDPGGQQDKRIALDQVFINLATSSTAMRSEPSAKPEYMLRSTFDAALGHIHGNRHLILLGDPGSGKTTLLRFLAHCLALAATTDNQIWLRKLSWQVKCIDSDLPAQEAWTVLASGRSAENDTITTITHHWSADCPIPVQVLLRDFATTNFDPTSPLSLWQFIAERLIVDGMTDAVLALEAKARCGELIFLLDGVDEVPPAQRPAVWRAIAALEDGPYGGNRWVATCRVLSFVPAEAPAAAPQQTLQKLDETQIDQFIASWYRALTENGSVTLTEADVKTDDLQQTAKVDRLLPLAENPMLLTIMVLVHTYYGRLPDERAKLYKACVDTLLLRWQSHKEPGGGTETPSLLTLLGTTKERLEQLLWEIAWQAHNDSAENGRMADITESQLLQIARQPQHLGDLVKAAQFLEYTEQRAHLLIGRGGATERVYTFPHRTFQEYLAACHLASVRRFPRQVAKLAAQGDPWREVLNLAAGELVYNRQNWETVLVGIERMLPDHLPDPDDLAGWRTIWLAGEMALAVGVDTMSNDPEMGQEILATLQTQLGRLLDTGALDARQRLAAGDALADLGDMRPGVGCVEHNGILVPDIAWGKEVPTGTYAIGGDKNTFGSVEKQEIEIERPYQLARYPVTYAQFQAFLDAKDFDDPRWWQDIPEGEKKPGKQAWPIANRPCERVSWYQAIAFCRWLSDKLDADLDLPHEYEWEIAARYPDGRYYPWGNDFDATKANTREGDSLGETSAVGMYPDGANDALDIYDLSGNVWEWCHNAYSDPEETGVGGAVRTLRGGSWNNYSRSCRAAYRNYLSPPAVRLTLGFRVCVRRPPSQGH